jgi:hypothetical protein
MRWAYFTRPGTVLSFLARLMPLTGFVIVVTTGGGWPG